MGLSSIANIGVSAGESACQHGFFRGDPVAVSMAHQGSRLLRWRGGVPDVTAKPAQTMIDPDTAMADHASAILR
jgi:hypothetical protein